jgi:hypothetical protein
MKQWAWRELRRRSWKLSDVDHLASLDFLHYELLGRSFIGFVMAVLVL